MKIDTHEEKIEFLKKKLNEDITDEVYIKLLIAELLTI